MISMATPIKTKKNPLPTAAGVVRASLLMFERVVMLSFFVVVVVVVLTEEQGIFSSPFCGSSGLQFTMRLIILQPLQDWSLWTGAACPNQTIFVGLDSMISQNVHKLQF